MNRKLIKIAEPGMEFVGQFSAMENHQMKKSERFVVVDNSLNEIINWKKREG